MNNLSGLIKQDIPKVIAVVDRPFSPSRLRGLGHEGVDVLEIRVDRFECGMEETIHYLSALRKNGVDLPFIGTIRETGKNREQRTELFRQIIPLVQAIDIEVDTPIRDNVVQLAHGKTIIVSHHDFESTPSSEGLAAVVDQANSGPCDIVKIAALARSQEDVTRLLCFAKENDTPMIAIAMGAIGSVSRVIGPLFGSTFTYGFLEGAVAPGQLSIEQLVDDLRRHFPAFDRKFDQFEK